MYRTNALSSRPPWYIRTFLRIHTPNNKYVQTYSYTHAYIHKFVYVYARICANIAMHSYLHLHKLYRNVGPTCIKLPTFMKNPTIRSQSVWTISSIRWVYLTSLRSSARLLKLDLRRPPSHHQRWSRRSISHNVITHITISYSSSLLIWRRSWSTWTECPPKAGFWIVHLFLLPRQQ